MNASVPKIAQRTIVGLFSILSTTKEDTQIFGLLLSYGGFPDQKLKK